MRSRTVRACGALGLLVALAAIFGPLDLWQRAVAGLLGLTLLFVAVDDGDDLEMGGGGRSVKPDPGFTRWRPGQPPPS